MVINMKKLPLGIQNFRKIISDSYVYVDKTKYVYDLINDASYYFLSRPRRFGKSLLLDTIAEAFSGDKELFNGLWIHGSDYSFEKHPVLRLDMSNIANKTPETLENSLLSVLLDRAKAEGFGIDSNLPSDVFKTLVEELHSKYGQRVVVLIDEYDKPILDHLQDVDAAEANRKVLRGFFGILKSMDPHLRMTFITGVSKFTKTSIFSELNNLLDITLTERYAGICGVPIEDLDRCFSDHIKDLETLERFKHLESLRGEILAWYDGYSWDGVNRLLNPFGLLSFFAQKRFSSFWYASGTPSFLIKLLKEKPASFLALGDLEMRERVLDSFDIHRIGSASLLFQTGYLTVKDVDYAAIPPVYALDIPNHEVREAFYLNIVAEFTEQGEENADAAYRKMSLALQRGDIQSMLKLLKGLFASIPYELHVDLEAYYHSILYAVMGLLGFDIDAEVSVSGGRVDAVLELADKVYVMEFKYEHCAKDASAEEKRELFDKALDAGMRQIKDRGYAKKYEGGGKEVVLAAFAFLGRDDIDMRMS